MISYCETDECNRHEIDNLCHRLLTRNFDIQLYSSNWVIKQILPEYKSIRKQTVPFHLMTNDLIQYMSSPLKEIFKLKTF